MSDGEVARCVAAFREDVIKIKYFSGRFSVDVRICHVLNVPRLASQPPSGYRASSRSGYPYHGRGETGLAANRLRSAVTDFDR